MPSSVIQAMRYEPRRRELLIVFRGGRGAYRYFDVGMEEWQAFLNAESKGTYLNEIFKKREHPYIRLMEPRGNVELVSAGAMGDRPMDDEALVWGEGRSLSRVQVQRVPADTDRERIRA